MSDMNSVKYRLPIYEEHLCRWERVRAACEGEEAVKALPKVLPYLNPQDASDANVQRNLTYLERAVYFNATGRTLEGLIGMAFARDPQTNFGKYEYLTNDSSGNGVSIYHVAQEALGGILQTGRYGLLTDIVNDQPVIVGYNAESIINWRVKEDGNVRKTILLVLKENLREDDGDYGSKEVEQYREFRVDGDRVEFTIWKCDKGGEPLVHKKSYLQIPHSAKTLGTIPFTFCGSINNSARIQPAPLKGLAEMNLAHFRDSADYQDSVWFCGQVQAWISGLDEQWRDKLESEGTYIGSRKTLLLPIGGQFGFEQAQPNMLAKEAMDSKREAMVALGARVVEQSPVTKTATQAAGDIATNTSVLGLCTSNVSEAITLNMRWLGLYDNAREFNEAKFEITKDFTQQTMNAQDVTALVAAWQASAMSRVDLRQNLRRMGVIAAERTDEMIDEEIRSEGWMDPPEPTGAV